MFETNENGEIMTKAEADVLTEKATVDGYNAAAMIENKCEQCGKVCKRAQDLKSHIKKMHKVVEVDSEPTDSDVEISSVPAGDTGLKTPDVVIPEMNMATNAEHIVIKDSNGIPIGEIPQEAIIPNTIVHELKEDTEINTELNGIIDSLWMQILDGASRAIILSYMDSKMATNKALIEIANRLIDGNEKAIILQYVRS